MPVDMNEVIGLLSELSREEGIQVAVKESVKGGLIAGGAALLGGLIAGPPGIAAGGAIGGLAGAYATSGKFKPLAIVLVELPHGRKMALYNKAKCIIDRVNYEDIIALGMIVASDTAMKAGLLMLVKDFVSTELRMEILD